jgi:hypothetical protein
VQRQVAHVMLVGKHHVHQQDNEKSEEDGKGDQRVKRNAINRLQDILVDLINC